MSLSDLYEKSRRIDREDQKSFGLALKVISGICVTVIGGSLYKLDDLKTLDFSWILVVALFSLLISLILSTFVVIGNAFIGKIDTSDSSTNLLIAALSSFIIGFVGIVVFISANLLA